jgi:mannose-6-phosphate isomerase
LAGLGDGAEVEHELSEWDYGDYEGMRSVDIRKLAPGWNLFRDGCPGGETPGQVSSRADRVIARLRTSAGNVAVFSHGQFSAALVARWIGEAVLEAQHFRLGTASISILSFDPHHPEVAVVDLLNSSSRESGRPAHGEHADARVSAPHRREDGWQSQSSEVVKVAPTSSDSLRPPLFPVRFKPIYQCRLWGGRRLANLVEAPLPPDAPVGEAWILSDRDDFPSIVVDGPMKGWTIKQLLERWPIQFLGSLAGRFDRFPLLLKFLDAEKKLSVQVHPSDSQRTYIPPGEHGKTEAWVVIETQPDACIYAGLNRGTSAADLARAAADHTLPQCLASLIPKAGDAVFIHSGTVHSLGGVVVFEIQENSDVTFRLYDWDHVDVRTGKPRELEFDQALAVIDFERGPVHAVTPEREGTGAVLTEKLFDCEHFVLRRHQAQSPFAVGAPLQPRVLVSLAGVGDITFAGITYPLRKGEVMLLPAAMGKCDFRPHGVVNVLEISIPVTGADEQSNG